MAKVKEIRRGLLVGLGEICGKGMAVVIISETKAVDTVGGTHHTWIMRRERMDEPVSSFACAVVSDTLSRRAKGLTHTSLCCLSVGMTGTAVDTGVPGISQSVAGGGTEVTGGMGGETANLVTTGGPMVVVVVIRGTRMAPVSHGRSGSSWRTFQTT